MFADVVEIEAGYDRSGVAGHRLANRVDEHHLPSPAADAGLGEAGVVVGKDASR